MSWSLNCRCICFNCCRTLCTSTLFASPSTKDLNILFHSFCTCSTLWTSFRALSCTVSGTVTLAKSYINASHLFWSLLCNPCNSTLLLLSTSYCFSRWDFSKTHSPRSCSNFLQPSLDSKAFCYKSSYFIVKIVIFRCNSTRGKAVTWAWRGSGEQGLVHSR
jgi:hypothetical protein